jgi:hypothetical protein
MKVRFLTILVMLIFVGFSSLATAHPCHRDPDYDNHRHCFNEPDPDPVVTYTLALSSGEFVFSAVDVYVDPKGKTLNGVDSLHLFRPGVDGSQAQLAWDKIFAGCSLMPSTVDSFAVADVSWSVTETGGKRDYALITFRLHDMVVYPTPTAANPDFDLNLTFRKNAANNDPLLPSEPSDTSLFPLDNYILWGSAQGGLNCQAQGEKASYQPLPMGSILEIKQK